MEEEGPGAHILPPAPVGVSREPSMTGSERLAWGPRAQLPSSPGPGVSGTHCRHPLASWVRSHPDVASPGSRWPGQPWADGAGGYPTHFVLPAWPQAGLGTRR